MENLSRLRWLCRRGMKELDVLMTRYLEEQYTQATESEKNCFRALLEMQDPELFSLLVGRTHSDDQALQHLVNQLRQLNSNG